MLICIRFDFENKATGRPVENGYNNVAGLLDHLGSYGTWMCGRILQKSQKAWPKLNSVS